MLTLKIKVNLLRIKLKILVLAANISTSSGGLKTGTLNLCKALIKKGHDVLLYTTTYSDTNEFFHYKGRLIYLEGVPVRFSNIQFNAMGNIFSVGLTKDLLKTIPSMDLVLIQSLYQITSTLAAIISKIYNIPYILRPHGTLDPVLFFRRRLLIKKIYINLFERWSFFWARAIQYSSKSEMLMTSRVIKNLAPGIIITEGISIEDFSRQSKKIDFRKRYPQFKDKRIILFLGRMHQKKGLEIALQAFSIASKKIEDIQMAIIGPGESNYVNQLISLTSRLRLDDRVFFLGAVDNELKKAALMDSDIFLLPSHGENFGIAVIEAIACGCPVILSNKVAVAEDLKNYGVALVADCDAVQMASAICTLCSDVELSNRMRSEGPICANKFYSLEAMATQMDVAYKSLLN